MKEKEILLEQYKKIYIHTTQKVTEWRQTANNYFLVINSFLLSFSGFLTTFSFRWWHIIIAITGISISVLWLLTLRSFRSLNTAKFKVIHKLEKTLPAKLFKDEWSFLKKGKDRKTYLKLSVLEQGIPIMILYSAIILIMWLGV